MVHVSISTSFGYTGKKSITKSLLYSAEPVAGALEVKEVVGIAIAVMVGFTIVVLLLGIIAAYINVLLIIKKGY